MPLLPDTLLFVHVPKTAGTSFRLAAQAHLGRERCVFDYGPAAADTSACIRDGLGPGKDFWALAQRLEALSPALLCGHFHVGRYLELVSLRHVVVFVRDPIAQLRSHYLHHRQHNGYTDSIETFAASDMGAGFQSRLLAGLPLEALGLVGVTERYADSLAQLNDLQGWQLEEQVLNRRADRADAQAPDPVTPELAKAFAQHARADFELFKRANRQLDARLAMARDRQVFTHGHLSSNDRQRWSGFAFRHAQDTPVTIEVLLNGVPALSLRAQEARPLLRGAHAPRGGHVGFSFQLAALRAQPGDEFQVRAADTGQPIGHTHIVTPRVATPSPAH